MITNPNNAEMRQWEKNCLDDLNNLIEKIGIEEFNRRGIEILTKYKENGNQTFGDVVDENTIKKLYEKTPKLLWYYIKMNRRYSRDLKKSIF